MHHETPYPHTTDELTMNIQHTISCATCSNHRNAVDIAARIFAATTRNCGQCKYNSSAVKYDRCLQLLRQSAIGTPLISSNNMPCSSNSNIISSYAPCTARSTSAPSSTSANCSAPSFGCPIVLCGRCQSLAFVIHLCRTLMSYLTQTP